MALFIWVMVGLALWHFTVFLPDNFYGGIVGAFCGALLGSIIFGGLSILMMVTASLRADMPTTSMFWFPAPATPDPRVEEFLAFEQDWLTGRREGCGYHHLRPEWRAPAHEGAATGAAGRLGDHRQAHAAPGDAIDGSGCGKPGFEDQGQQALRRWRGLALGAWRNQAALGGDLLDAVEVWAAPVVMDDDL